MHTFKSLAIHTSAFLFVNGRANFGKYKSPGREKIQEKLIQAGSEILPPAF
jgi:hypothetical protein